jgi:hypothetical protein
MTDHIWATRRPGESAKAFAAFEVYRDMGPDRSIQKVGKQLAKNPKTLARHSKRHEWVKRAAAFDGWVSEEKAKKTAREIIEMNQRHAMQAQSFQEIALLPLNEIKKRMRSETCCYFDRDFDKLDTTAVVEFVLKSFRMYQQAVKIECSAREVEQKRVQPDLKTGKVPTLTISPDLVNTVKELVDKQIAERMLGQHEPQPKDKEDPGEEKPASSGGFPECGPILKKRTARGLERKGAEDKSTTIDVKSLLENTEFISFIETLIHNRPEQMTSLHQDAQAEDKRVEEDEGSVESKECPVSRPVWRKKPTLVIGNSSVVENQSLDPALLNKTEKKEKENER